MCLVWFPLRCRILFWEWVTRRVVSCWGAQDDYGGAGGPRFGLVGVGSSFWATWRPNLRTSSCRALWRCGMLPAGSGTCHCACLLLWGGLGTFVECLYWLRAVVSTVVLGPLGYLSIFLKACVWCFCRALFSSTGGIKLFVHLVWPPKCFTVVPCGWLRCDQLTTVPFLRAALVDFVLGACCAVLNWWKTEEAFLGQIFVPTVGFLLGRAAEVKSFWDTGVLQA